MDNRQKKIAKLFQKYETTKDGNGDFVVFAKLTRSQFNSCLNGRATIEVPYGVQPDKIGDRTFRFICQDVRVYDELINGLDDSGMVWWQ
jgi:hypothetical protein